MLRVGVIGAGRAGRARIRAIEANADTELHGIVSSQRDIGTRSIEELLDDPEVDAVCVCSINCAHASQVEQALQAGKHVLCEYPLALSHADAERLFDLAAEQTRVLHVEHIELLSGTQRALRQAYEELGRPRPTGGTYYSQANSEGWIASVESAGFPSFSGVSRLHRLVDLFGSTSAVDATFDSHEDEQRLQVDLKFAEGGECRLDYRRARGLPRREEWSVRCENGELTTVPPLPTESLFAQDLDAFARRVREGAEAYVTTERVLEVLDIAERVRVSCEGKEQVAQGSGWD